MRHREVTRLEGFSDAVFGFALTLLVVQLETPDTPEELDLLVRGSIPFALMFAMVSYIWWEHNKFFRRTGLQDATTAFLNSVLLFVVLFYVYPFKYLTVAVLGPVFGLRPVVLGDASNLMLLYSGAIFLIFGTLLALYSYAWRKRATLELDSVALLELRFGWRSQLVSTSIALASILLALVLPNRQMAFAGMIFALMGPLHGWNGFAAGAALARERKRVQPPASSAA
jgi:uncharacterized membrane protein